MPVYPFFCRDCRKTFEVIRPVADGGGKRVQCPRCKGNNVERTWSTVSVKTSKKS